MCRRGARKVVRDGVGKGLELAVGHPELFRALRHAQLQFVVELANGFLCPAPFGDFRGERAVRCANLVFELLVEPREIVARLGQFAVFLHGCLIRGEKQVQDLRTVGGDDVVLSAENDVDANARFLPVAQVHVGKQVIDSRQQVHLVVRLGHEIIRAALEPAKGRPRDRRER